jgi:hypothetical protein
MPKFLMVNILKFIIVSANTFYVIFPPRQIALANHSNVDSSRILVTFITAVAYFICAIVFFYVFKGLEAFEVRLNNKELTSMTEDLSWIKLKVASRAPTPDYT